MKKLKHRVFEIINKAENGDKASSIFDWTIMILIALSMISRDILCYAMQTLRTSRIVAHVHDELIIECPPDISLQAVSEQMGRTPPWASGLVLRADGDEMKYYQKA